MVMAENRAGEGPRGNRVRWATIKAAVHRRSQRSPVTELAARSAPARRLGFPTTSGGLGWALGGWAHVSGGVGEIGFAAFEQLQPDLAAGGEGGDGLPEQLDRGLADDGDRRRVPPVRYCRAG